MPFFGIIFLQVFNHFVLVQICQINFITNIFGFFAFGCAL